MTNWPVQPFTIRRTCSPLDFGAAGDNETDDTVAVQSAINSCSTIVFDSGKRFLIGDVMLNHSNLHLRFEANASAILLPSGGGLLAWCSGCIYENVSVVGAGGRSSVIDGQGWRWWSTPGIAHKPKLLVLHNVRSACVRGMLFRDSPTFHLLMRGDRMSIVDCRVEAGLDNCDGYATQPNTDAFHTHGTNIYLANLFVHNGDDGFPVEAGGASGYGEDTRNVLVENCHAECGSNAGIIMLGSGNASVRDVVYRNTTANRTNQGGGVKISEPYESVHGRATNITWVGLTVVAPRAAAVYVNVFEENADPGEPYGCVMPNASVLRNDTHWMTVQGAVFRDVRVRELGATALGGCFNCAPGTPCALRLEQVALPESAAFVCHNEGAGLSQFCGRRL